MGDLKDKIMEYGDNSWDILSFYYPLVSSNVENPPTKWRLEWDSHRTKWKLFQRAMCVFRMVNFVTC